MTEKDLRLQRNKQELSKEGKSGWPEMGTCLLSEKIYNRKERKREKRRVENLVIQKGTV